MKRGEAGILAAIGLVVVGLMARNAISLHAGGGQDPGIPFFSTADPVLARQGADLYRVHNCRQCHSLWTVKSAFESVPAPLLDGIGSLHDEAWFYRYFSAANPQDIVASRLKVEYRMPSLAGLSDDERRLLAKYMASLRVKDWYLATLRASEYEKLTGKAYPASHADK